MTTRPGIGSARVRAAIAVGAAVFLVLAGTGTGHAYWTATSTLSATTTAAPLSITLGGANALATTYKTEAPATSSATVITTPPITLVNTGATPLAYSVATTTSAATLSPADVKLSLWSPSGSSCATGILTAQQGTLAAPPNVPAGSTVAAGATAYLCAATQLLTSTAASQGKAITVTFTVTGRVGTNWTTTAAGSARQDVFRITPAVAVTCTSGSGFLGLGNTVTLAWSYPAGATGLSVTITGFTRSGTKTSAVFTGTGTSRVFSYSGSSTSTAVGTDTTVLSLVVSESQYGTSSDPVTQNIVQTSLIGLGAGVACP